MRPGAATWIAAALGMLLAGCRVAGAPPLVPVRGEELRLTGWLDRLRSEGDARMALRAVGRLRVNGPAGRGSLREVVAVERPARLRLEALNLLGQTQSLLVSDGEAFAYYDGRTLERGDTAPGLLARLGLDLDPAEAIDVLLAAPRLPESPPGEILGDGEDRVVDLAGRRLRFDAQGMLRRVETRTAAGELRWSAEYRSWRTLPGGTFPFELALYFPASDVRAELDLDEVELNPELSAALFRVASEVD